MRRKQARLKKTRKQELRCIYCGTIQEDIGIESCECGLYYTYEHANEEESIDDYLEKKRNNSK